MYRPRSTDTALLCCQRSSPLDQKDADKAGAGGDAAAGATVRRTCIFNRDFFCKWFSARFRGPQLEDARSVRVDHGAWAVLVLYSCVLYTRDLLDYYRRCIHLPLFSASVCVVSYREFFIYGSV